MLQIKNVRKKYITGDLEQIALNGVSVNFRDQEFVAILGPSGSGKTTLLNIIGGLDRYDSGDLIINGISTKKYKDKDWDSYRNHTIGFVFQSYNLIPHQTVLANVELALTISGVSKRERKNRALEALDKVGLKQQAHKKPNQMSGGQMQRVAIARALVNNPKILLADEPTGALDTKTSVQVMDILKEVAKDRLVVMVTHNPELAYEYANRIVRVQDGEIIEDTNKLDVTEDGAIHKNLGKSSMSLFSSFSLSLNNLLTKKGRTILTSFAGSIGIIGIALILSLSTGFQNYIDQIQEDTMTSYPLTIQSETANIFSAMLGTVIQDNNTVEEGNVIEQQMISSIMGSIGSNDIKSLKKWIESNPDKWQDDVKKISYAYGISPLIYTKDITDSIVQINPNTLMSSIYSDGAASLMSMVSSSSSMGTFSEKSIDTIMNSTEILEGRYPEKYNEVIIVLSSKNRIADLLLYSLGLKDNSELKASITKVMAGETVEMKEEPLVVSYKDLMNVDIRLVDATSLYQYNNDYQTYENMSDNKEWMNDIYENSEKLEIVGLAVSTGDNSSGGVFYLPDLTRYVIEKAEKSEIVKAQIANKEVDVFSGNRFDEDKKESGLDFNDMISIDEDMLSSAFKVNINTDALSESDMANIVMSSSEFVSKNIKTMTETMGTAISGIYKATATGIISGYNTIASVTIPNSCERWVDKLNPSLGCSIESEGEIDVISKNETINILQELKVEVENGDIEYENVDASIISAAIDMTIAAVNIYPEEEIKISEINSILDTTINSQDFREFIDNKINDKKYSVQGLTVDPSNYSYVNGIYVNNDDGYKDFYTTAGASIYRDNAITDDVINGIASQIPDISISVKNMKTFLIDTFNLYIERVPSNSLGMAKPSDLPSVEGIINESLERHASMIGGEAYNLASDYIVYLVAQGMGETIGKVMEPISSMFSNKDLITFDSNKFAKAFNFNMNEDELTRLMTSMMTSGSASYSNNLLSLGYQDIDEPTSMSFFFNDFDSKENFLNTLKNYNDSVEEESEISYTDITGLLMSSVQTIITSVTYVLIAFVSISLVVSSIMIGIITMISVMERTKEIGILRAIGASKRNISTIFNAETFIVGLLSGLIGIGSTYLLNIPANIIIHGVNENITSVLEPQYAVILVIISVILTLIGGIIPSKSAAKKDPVLALRSD